MDYTDVRQFLVAAIQGDSNLNDLDCSPDSGFDDLVIKPHMLLSQAIFNYIESYGNTVSLANISSLTSSQLDAVVSKFFVSRRTNASLSLQLTIYLNQTNNTVLTILTTDSFRTSDGIVFNPIQTYVLVPSALSTVTVNGQTLYVANITVVSNNASRQVLANEISSYTINHPALVNVVNLGSSPPPVLAETDAQLITKLQNSLSNRNLINRPAIFNSIMNAFPDSVVSIYSIGYGDPEMQRDIVPAGQAWSFHVGGTIDIFAVTSLTPVTVTATASRITGNIYRVILKRFKGFDNTAVDSSNPHPGLLYGWEKVELPDASMPGQSTLPILPLIYIDYASNTFSIGGLTKSSIEIDAQTLDYKIKVIPKNSKNLRYSIYEQLELNIYLTEDAGDNPTVTIPYFTMGSLEDLQNFVANPQTTFHCADTLVKSFIPIEIRDFTIKYDSKYAIDVAGLTTTLCNIINNWNSPEHIRMTTLLSNVPVPVRIGEIGEDFPANSDLINPDGYITSVPSQLSPTAYNALPTYVEVVQHNIDDTVYHFVATDQICSIEKPQLSSTRRTVKYFIQPENLHFVPSSW